MPRSIHIRDVPDEIHAELRKRASAAGTSLSDYLLAEITRVAERPPVAEVLERATSRSGGANTQEIAAAVRSGRDRDG